VEKEVKGEKEVVTLGGTRLGGGPEKVDRDTKNPRLQDRKRGKKGGGRSGTRFDQQGKVTGLPAFHSENQGERRSYP